MQWQDEQNSEKRDDSLLMRECEQCTEKHSEPHQSLRQTTQKVLRPKGRERITNEAFQQNSSGDSHERHGDTHQEAPQAAGAVQGN
jgi:hypothetical protein